MSARTYQWLAGVMLLSSTAVAYAGCTSLYDDYYKPLEGAGGSMPTCSDSLQNGNEADVDCGESCPQRCDLGLKCTGDADCSSGFCTADKVCCSERCDGLCRSCLAAHTGKSDGTCSPVMLGSDPHNDCDEQGNQTCQKTGACDGVGACALVGCTPPHASASCTAAGECTISKCEDGWKNCDLKDDTGCEQDIFTDVNHCGACNTPCKPANGMGVCNEGICTIGSCDDGFGDCNNTVSDGCEADLATSEENCGACGRGCSDSHVLSKNCSNGVCDSTCQPGFGNCVLPASGEDDGCETDLLTHVDHCGACDRGCSDSHVLSKNCSNGVCDSTCQLGFGNCDQPASGNDNGCETPTAASINGTNDGPNVNCGGCGNSCAAQGGMGNNDFECDGGGMAAAQKYCGCSNDNECNGGFCVAVLGGVCTCDDLCQPGEACVNNSGTVSCSCNGGTGCGSGETCCQTPPGCFNLTQDNPANCGACGHACPSGFYCGGSQCLCNSNDDCDAGTIGECVTGSGKCKCNQVECSPGQRCQPDGKCG